MLILLVLSAGMLLGQQTDPRDAFRNIRTLQGQTITTNIRDLIPAITIVTTKTNTTPPIGSFDYKLTKETITEKSVNLIKNWRKESK